ncbi:MAG TPA: hypothetical protein VGQ83_01900 [Polyangia bacterium]|jgi:hypothetical protein
MELVRPRVQVHVVVLLLAAVGLAVALETVLKVPVRLPGHRALPGAFALLACAAAFRAVPLLLFATAVPAVIALLGYHGPSPLALFAVWLLPAVAIVIAGEGRLRRSVVFFVAVGLLFGLLRLLATRHGLHHTPDLVRGAGHLAFGLLGGLGAWAATRPR